jgi:hypothetical protein
MHHADRWRKIAITLKTLDEHDFLSRWLAPQ